MDRSDERTIRNAKKRTRDREKEERKKVFAPKIQICSIEEDKQTNERTNEQTMADDRKPVFPHEVIALLDIRRRRLNLLGDFVRE